MTAEAFDAAARRASVEISQAEAIVIAAPALASLRAINQRLGGDLNSGGDRLDQR